MSRFPLIEPFVGDEELENVRRVLESGYLTQGPYATELEELVTQRTDTEHAIVSTSCTAGLELALDAIGIGAGDEVVVPAFTYPATATAVVRVGGTPVLADVDEETYNIDPESAAAAITDDTAALLPVSWGGQPLNPKPLRALATDNDLAIVEDAACSLGAEFNGERVGSQFDASVFSFHPRKVLTTGEGGAITVDSDELEAEIRRIKNFGTNPETDEGFVRADATNSRMSDVLAAIGVAQLGKADEIIEKRRRLAQRYDELLTDVSGVSPPTETPGGTHTYQSYCVYIEPGEADTRDRLIETLAESGIETQIGTYALQNTAAFADSKRVGTLATAADLEASLLTLPLAHSMTDADQRTVVDELDAVLDSIR